MAGHKDVVVTAHCVEIAGHRDVCVSGALYEDCGGIWMSMPVTHCMGIAGYKDVCTSGAQVIAGYKDGLLY